MAARTPAVARSALLPADGLAAGLLEADGDGLLVADRAGAGRGERRDTDSEGSGVLRFEALGGDSEFVVHSAWSIAAQAGVEESAVAASLATGSPRPRR